MLFKTKDITKAKRYEIRLTDKEKVELQKKADASKLHLSEYLIRCGLGRPIAKSNTSDLIIELVKLSRLLKEFHSIDRRYENQYLEILKAIVKAIKSIPHRFTSG